MQGLRSATGVLVLSTALLIGSAGGATAVADTDGGDSTARSSDSDGSTTENGASTASGVSVASIRESLRTTFGGRDPLLSREADSVQLSATSVDGQDVEESVVAELESAESDVAVDVEALAEAEPSEDRSTAEALSAATASEVTDAQAAPEPVVAAPETGTGEAEPVAAVPVTATPTGGSSPTRPAVVASEVASTAHGSPAAEPEAVPAIKPPTLNEVVAELTTDLVGTSTAVVATLGNTVNTVVVSLGDAVAAIPPALWALPTSETPLSDVLALVEVIMNSVTQSATAVMLLPSDLAANFGFLTIGPGTGPALVGEQSAHRDRVVVAPDEPVSVAPTVAAPMLPLAPQQLVDDVVARSGFAAHSPIAFTALAAPSQVVPASIPAMAGKYETLFDRAFGAMLVPLSLWALATGALPGLVGLLVVFGAGARVGYRQAKAGFALKMAGIARFAGPGPLGVVRSGSLVTLHQRGVRVGGQRIPRWSALGDQAA
ncbi:MAG: hypothetical protein K0U76_07295 [Actinomycetia bacterium]|nr:hypothetical protein [Actinomycetes bacterium]MCH9701181.1 hypothetical protein [Actinomycetes bacterium]MCH9759892.1 hypothetical protein [Actinomycetes bacterium]